MRRAPRFAVTVRGAGLAALALCGLMALCGRAEAGTLYGLVVGIDAYSGTGNALAGADNDAADIAAALKRAGAGEVVKLDDGAATRPAIAAGWQKLLGRARRGDTLIFSFAGKGTLEAGKRVLLLAGFSPKGDASKADASKADASKADAASGILPLKTIFGWFKAADAKGVHAVLVADASFGGSLARPSPAGLVRLRQWCSGASAGSSKTSGSKTSSSETSGPMPSSPTVFPPEDAFSACDFIYASGPGRAAPEISINGEPRGALSYAFARALDGRADDNGDGQVTDQELAHYLPLAVRALTEGQQTPRMMPSRAMAQVLFTVSPGKAYRVAALAEPILRVALDGEPAGLELPKSISQVSDPANADLIWSAKTKRLENRIGGLAAAGLDGTHLGQVLASWAALAWLNDQAALNPAPASLVSGYGSYGPGALVQVELLPARYRYLTEFDVSADGGIVLLAPEGPADIFMQNFTRQHLHQMFQTGRQADGAQHRVVILTDDSLSGLADSLSKMEAAHESRGLLAVLKKALPPGAKAQFAVFPIYSRPGG